jgi:dTDP-4-amino-4,6-dideoxygalactose transaminase
VRSPGVPSGLQHSYQSYVVLLDEDIDRDLVIDAMKADDVEVTLGTYSMHLQPYFRERFHIPDEALPAGTRAQASALTIPLYPQLTSTDVEKVVSTLAGAVASVRNATR